MRVASRSIEVVLSFVKCLGNLLIQVLVVRGRGTRYLTASLLVWCVVDYHLPRIVVERRRRFALSILDDRDLMTKVQHNIHHEKVAKETPHQKAEETCFGSLLMVIFLSCF
jgi:hypothetical protein